jgi:hypothetical protein
MEQVAKETARVLSDFLPREVIESVVSHYTTNMLRYG